MSYYWETSINYHERMWHTWITKAEAIAGHTLEDSTGRYEDTWKSFENNDDPLTYVQQLKGW
jgi:hypothetical protein